MILTPPPDDHTAIAVFGKSQGRSPRNLQLEARVGMAAALWHATPGAKPTVVYVAKDIGGPDRAPHSDAVRRQLARYGVPRSHVVTRRSSNCTFVEVRAVRDLCAELGLDRVVGVTHGYHAGRTKRYLDEVVPHAAVVSVGPEALPGPGLGDFAGLGALRELIAAAEPRGPDLWRERAVEMTMTLLHSLDGGGRLERRLADAVRKPAL